MALEVAALKIVAVISKGCSCETRAADVCGTQGMVFRRGWLRLVLPIVGRLAWFFRGGMVFSRRARGERLWDWLLGA